MNTSRSDALRAIAAEFASDPVVFICGSTSREMAACHRRPNHHRPARIAAARKRKRPGQSRANPSRVPTFRCRASRTI